MSTKIFTRRRRSARRPALPQSPITRFWKRVKRIILVCSGLLFAGFCFAAYHEFHGTLSSRPGRVLTWSTGAALAPLFESLPWWSWACFASLAVYLWMKHKLIMSIVYGVLVGLALAMS